ncbi:phenylalanine--tRNA ligase subunit beta [Wenzhouxiangella sp. XN24]|uniref:phenylalanine--tRNA ligase subunit beta n=1 Tax=Wenzhouxiangella sp. XN24 TaxID=2713569 RepID=UPI0013EC6096|nr:phenylalanine--tRNA ligase subunit beta [Wenzhouxiangella sp. XN24]NGX16477.1 phenylalanine--tRNA ligase subunit beta [Wenzhouxiangella sp. XN24]
MKISERWLREWVDPPVDTAGIVAQLTMAGLEVDGTAPAAPAFSSVVIGRVESVAPHPDADKLKVCRVEVGAAETLGIVCGAPNVYAGMRAPVALVGGALPGGLKIKRAKLRGVSSVGMLCSERELGLGESHEGLWDLPQDAPVGVDLRTWLSLDDTVIDVDLTPNRGDCFSVLGVAREVALLNDAPLSGPVIAPVPAAVDDTFSIEVRAPEACPRFVGRVIRGIRSDAVTPLWMAEKLRRAGLRPIHPVVDVTNFVMLELGQPMHGFDLGRLEGGIVVRHAAAGERITLLDGREVTLEPDMLVIADHAGPRAVAGIMGGEASGVTAATRDVFFEVAFFDPQAIAGRARRLGLHTDASLRFERGVDPAGQERAVERATALLVEIAGGAPGPVMMHVAHEHLPQRAPVRLRRARLDALLGHVIPDADVERMLGGLGMTVLPTPDGWEATPPSHRFDMAVEVDLVEEVARVYGYDRLPESRGAGGAVLGQAGEHRAPASRIADTLISRGYQEVVTYSFVDPELQSQLLPGERALALANPISSELSTMRLSLWPGLLQVMKRNLSRRQPRVRIFEQGLRFIYEGNELKQLMTVGGLLAGARLPEQWGAPAARVDFFDAKRDVELLLDSNLADYRFEAAEHPALHPGQAARIVVDGHPAGWIGALHPRLVRVLDLDAAPLLWELDEALGFAAKLPAFREISRFPAIRRDIAVVVDQAVPVQALVEAIRHAAGRLLTESKVFDVYSGDRIDSGLKSVAFGLILQESSRTLTDEEADGVVAAVVARLASEFGARLRD